VAVVGAFAVTATAPLARAQAPEKKVKDQGEYDLFNQTLKDANNPAQHIKDLYSWTQKYPESDYKDDRLLYYLQAYNASNNPAKVLEVGSGLISRDLKTVFGKDPKNGPQQILQVLYLTTANFAKLQTATPEQMAQGIAAANALKDYVGQYFTAANKPAATSDTEWAKTKDQVAGLSNAVLMSTAARPGAEAMAK
jgi:hypothetical protein